MGLLERQTMELGKDGTFKDYCHWYGGDCGECPKLEKGFPECFERRENVKGPDVYCHECSKAGGAERAIYHLPPVCS